MDKIMAMGKFRIFLLISCLWSISASKADAQESNNKSTPNKAENLINISTAPVFFPFGSYDLDVELGLTRYLTLGPKLMYNTFTSSFSTTGNKYSVGVVATVSIGHPKFTNGWVLRPFLSYASGTASTSGIPPVSVSASGLDFGANVGYGWFWNSGINLSLGFGYQYLNSVTFSSNKIYATTGGGPSLLIQLGYAF
jgi:hypothetical protein